MRGLFGLGLFLVGGFSICDVLIQCNMINYKIVNKLWGEGELENKIRE